MKKLKVKKENSEFSEKQIGGSLGDDDGQTHHDNNENGGEGMELSITHAKFYIDKILDIIYFIKVIQLLNLSYYACHVM